MKNIFFPQCSFASVLSFFQIITLFLSFSYYARWLSIFGAEAFATWLCEEMFTLEPILDVDVTAIEGVF
jgi:hypothetical protein